MSPANSAPDVAGLASAVPLFAALGDEHRFGLVTRLSTEGPLSVTQLSQGQTITRQAVTKHLRVLADAGVLVDRQRGRERLWQVQPQPLNEARYWLDRISEQWDEALERLRVHVEGDSAN
jgi:DNA-binding transcriptional ArsR family regulator